MRTPHPVIVIFVFVDQELKARLYFSLSMINSQPAETPTIPTFSPTRLSRANKDPVRHRISTSRNYIWKVQWNTCKWLPQCQVNVTDFNQEENRRKLDDKSVYFKWKQNVGRGA